MSWFSLLGIAVALAADAFAAAVVAGLGLQVLTKRHVFRLSFHFGLFQAAMLTVGWLIGSSLYALVAAAAHWLACALLLLVGGNIIRQALHDDAGARAERDPTKGWQLIFLAFATSLDALAVGLSFAMMRISIATAASVVGITAAALTLLGVSLGNRASILWGKRIEVLGGLILIVIAFMSL